MAIRDIVKDGDPILRKTCRPQASFDSKLSQILDDMLDTMMHAEGVGLAAPQIGLLRRYAICLMESGEVIELINPTLLASNGEDVMNEGCLSCPKDYRPVPRPTYIKLQYQSRTGQEIEREFHGFDARVCLHEMDHLDGVLFYDKAVKE